MDPAIVNHLFLTSRFLVKGRVATGGKRLTDLLEMYRRDFLAIDDITLFDVEHGDQVISGRGHLRMEDVLLAHEFLDVSSDDHLRSMFEKEDHEYVMASMYFRPPGSVEVVGRVRRSILQATRPNEFFVVQSPNVKGLNDRSEPDFLRLQQLSYAIVNRSQVHCLFEYE